MPSGTVVAEYTSVVFRSMFLLREELYMSEGKSVANNLIWAVAMIIIVGMVAGALYYGGILSGKKKHEVDVEVSVPGVTNSR